MTMGSAESWQKLAKLIDDAAQDETLRRDLQYGTPARKLQILEERGVTWPEGVEMQQGLEKVIYKGSVPWWWW